MSVRNVVLAVLAVLLAITIVAWVGWRLWPQSVDAVSINWSGSGHADRASTSFTLWDDDDPPVVPPVCAKCHSTLGFLDFLGEDGTAPGQVDGPAQTGTTVQCVACHNESAQQMTSVVFPSGDEVSGLRAEARCMQCHQGRTSTLDVEEATAGLDPDEVSEELGFINVHYRVAAATQMGSEARGAYQYEGQTYTGRYRHVEDYRRCNQCHDAHTLQIEPQTCSPCHSRVTSFPELRLIRTRDTDFDGDGNTTEGVSGEIATMHERLYEAIRAYAADVVGTPIAYAPSSPFWLADEDGDGVLSPDDITGENEYASWTPRLLRAAYNYHYVLQDPGQYVHNPDYVMQFLYDSLADLSEQVPVDITGMVRP